MISRGYSRIVKQLVEEIEETKRCKILHSHIVSDIKWDEHSKKVHVLGTSEEKKEFDIIGDFCVVTVSLGILKAEKIKFTPALPESKVDSIKRMGFGTINKVVLGFKKSFWPDDVEWIGKNYVAFSYP